MLIPTDEPNKSLEDGIGLCLSGGGYRAMLFHVGALWRLYETGLLGKVHRVSSVSGGSITAGLLALKWQKLSFDSAKITADFIMEVVTPIRKLASETIDVSSILLKAVLPGNASPHVMKAYDEHLFGGATLQDIPDYPLFIFNATNVQSGVLWRFMKPYMADYRVGMVKSPTIKLSQAVAASSAFPPLLSPIQMALQDSDVLPTVGADLNRPPYTNRVFLTDGGVYDNLGLETVWKNYTTVLISDAGAKMEPEEVPRTDWAEHMMRVLDLIDNQVRALRKRQAVDSFVAGLRKGTYWGISTDIQNYQLHDALDCPYESTVALSKVPTRLAHIPDTLQEQLINWGYAVCDAAVRAHVDGTIGAPADFPYPQSKVRS